MPRIAQYLEYAKRRRLLCLLGRGPNRCHWARSRDAPISYLTIPKLFPQYYHGLPLASSHGSLRNVFSPSSFCSIFPQRGARLQDYGLVDAPPASPKAMSFLFRKALLAPQRCKIPIQACPAQSTIREYHRRRIGLALKPTWTGASANKRYVTTEAGDGKSGHINAGKNEGIFFLDSELPSISHSRS